MARTSSGKTGEGYRKTVRFDPIEGERIERAVIAEIGHQGRTLTFADLVRRGTMNEVGRIERRDGLRKLRAS